MDYKYIKVKFSDEEIAALEKRSAIRGIKRNELIRDAALCENPIETFCDLKKIEEHTMAIREVKEEFKKVFFTSFEDKILMSDWMKEVENKLFELEILEAKFLHEARCIRYAMRGVTVEEGEEDGNDQP